MAATKGHSRGLVSSPPASKCLSNMFHVQWSVWLQKKWHKKNQPLIYFSKFHTEKKICQSGHRRKWKKKPQKCKKNIYCKWTLTLELTIEQVSKTLCLHHYTADTPYNKQSSPVIWFCWEEQTASVKQFNPVFSTSEHWSTLENNLYISNLHKYVLQSTELRSVLCVNSCSTRSLFKQGDVFIIFLCIQPCFVFRPHSWKCPCEVPELHRQIKHTGTISQVQIVKTHGFLGIVEWKEKQSNWHKYQVSIINIWNTETVVLKHRHCEP